MSFLERINSDHADLAIAYKPWVYTSHLRKGLISQGACNPRGLYPRGRITGIEKAHRNRLWQC